MTADASDRARLIASAEHYGWTLLTDQMDPSMWTTIQMERKATRLSVSFTPHGRLKMARVVAPKDARQTLWDRSAKLHERRIILDDTISTVAETAGDFCLNCNDPIIKYDGRWLHYGTGVAACRLQLIATPRPPVE